MKLIIQPDAGVLPVVEAIKKARKTIDVVIFRFDLNVVEKALADAVQRGVMVRALIAHTNRGGASKLRKLEQRMLAAGLNVSRTADDLLRYHAKFMICDGRLHLLGFNFTKLDIVKSRSFAISTKDRKAVQEAAKVFEADLTRQPYVPSKSHLVVSPETSRARLADFIKGARKELAIYDEKVNDLTMIRLLKERVSQGRHDPCPWLGQGQARRHRRVQAGDDAPARARDRAGRHARVRRQPEPGEGRAGKTA